MELAPIPGTDLCVSKICLGTSQMGTAISVEESFSLLDMFTGHGGNFLDTAHVYGDWVPDIERSACERTLGMWLKSRNNRETVIIGTKGGHWTFDAPHVSRVTPKEIVSDIDASLRCLGTDYVDLYWLHRDDASQPVEELVQCLEMERLAGKIRWYGASNWSAPRMIEAQNYAVSEGIPGFIATQVYWNAAALNAHPFSDPGTRCMTRDLYEFHNKTGVAAIPYQSQAGGLFTKLAGCHNTPDDWRPAPQFDIQENNRRLAAIVKLMDETGLTMTQTVLAFLLSQPFATFPIVGCRLPEQLRDSLAAGSAVLSREQLQTITRVPWHNV